MSALPEDDEIDTFVRRVAATRSAPPVDARVDTSGRYELGGLVGRGGMSEVYEAVERATGDRVAIKVPAPRGRLDACFVIRFVQHEHRVIERLRHPNIIATRGVVSFGAQRGLVLELLPGEPLQRVLRAGPLDPGDALRVSVEVLSALEHAHARGVIHADIKPGNVFMTVTGDVKLLDFGVARVVPTADGGPSIAPDQGLAGTALYMSPARLRGEPAEVTDDLWAAALLAWETFTGQHPYEGRSWRDLYARLRDGAVDEDLLPSHPNVPDGVLAVLRRALHPREDVRFRDARAMRLALAAVTIDDTAREPSPRLRSGVYASRRGTRAQGKTR
jgi:serine/threonine-protein kinase